MMCTSSNIGFYFFVFYNINNIVNIVLFRNQMWPGYFSLVTIVAVQSIYSIKSIVVRPFSITNIPFVGVGTSTSFIIRLMCWRSRGTKHLYSTQTGWLMLNGGEVEVSIYIAHKQDGKCFNGGKGEVSIYIAYKQDGKCVNSTAMNWLQCLLTDLVRPTLVHTLLSRHWLCYQQHYGNFLKKKCLPNLWITSLI